MRSKRLVVGLGRLRVLLAVTLWSSPAQAVLPPGYTLLPARSR